MDIQKLMKQAQQMQAKMQKAQAELANKTVTAEVGGGQVTVVMNGQHVLVDLKINPAAVDPADVEFLQDMLLSAINEAVRKVDELVQQEMGGAMGGLSIPGLNLPGM
ncbi:MAG TPA: YbaB/EbfC family nucleoid-associated protein [Candidatus Krumholzibacteria bacterium]|nr:YbaB/EbfC family nucleoid-associated protein [Candidatus Krumholzibacteria bacterium]HPD72721.1 YbaB/EbfC family nucleoid-associated protein [Candidatus Krumholzibacteria bacterium]HRY40347.1 YbaB/EbfC family nucleoid-associated protein [Candidatus Krumholzibacteria bacterium]